MGLSYADACRLGIGHLHPDATGPRVPLALSSTTEKTRIPTKNAKGQNKTEARFDARLAELKEDGRIKHYEFETIRLRMADRTWLLPDFPIWLPDDRLIFAEVKGAYIREDAMIKIKTIAEIHRFPFFLAVYDKGWHVRLMPSRWDHGERITIFE